MRAFHRCIGFSDSTQVSVVPNRVFNIANSRNSQAKTQAEYLTMEKYDAVIISEFPNDEASAKFMLGTGALGNVTTQTMKAFTEGEYRKIVTSL
jgi:uncharacterized protein with GYD domain